MPRMWALNLRVKNTELYTFHSCSLYISFQTCEAQVPFFNFSAAGIGMGTGTGTDGCTSCTSFVLRKEFLYKTAANITNKRQSL
jgi:hypothetical protein